MAFTTGMGLARLRAELREWLGTHTPDGWQGRMANATKDEFRQFNLDQAAILDQAGLLVAHWPDRFGGGGFSFRELLIIQEEMVRFDFPQPRLLEITLQHVAATLMAHGTPDQQQHLSLMRHGEIWAQGFSEPNAGSDLASLTTRAVRDGSDYVLDGQKVWSSYADQATWCLLLARTDPSVAKHRGISLFMLDLSTPGVELRPIRQATGTEEFCEIFLTAVRVPAAGLVGAENDGWRLAQTTLSTERASQIIELQARLAIALESVWRQAEHVLADDGRPAIEHDDIRQELAARTAEVDVLGLIGSRLAEGVEAHGDIGPEGSFVKVFYSETLQRVTRAAVRINGLGTMVDTPREFATTWTSGKWMIDHLKSWNWTIAAGSNEIQRNIIGERVLGLPREPQA